MSGQCSGTKRKRTNGPTREFDPEWDEQYLFVENAPGKPCCLVCKAPVAVVKKYNIERHFKTNHDGLNITHPIGSELRAELLRKLKSSLRSQQNLFRRANAEMENSIFVTFEIAFLLARKKKPFTDAEEIIRPALDIISQRLLNDADSNVLRNIALSRSTMTRRSEDLARNVREQLNEFGRKCEYFSICMDESTDICDISQLAIFVRSVDGNFDVIEELLHLKALHGTTKGSDLFSELKSCIDKTTFSWAKLESICTDGAPALVGRTSGCIALLEKFLARPLLKYHCLIHQEALVGKTMNLSHVMNVVVKCVNKIMAGALNHRQFKAMLEEIEAQYTDLLLHCNVRWLSRGKVLARFWELKEQVLEFLVEKNELRDEREFLRDEDWLTDLAFLTDITAQLNQLNLRLQGSTKIFANIASDIMAFELRLKLFIANMERGCFDHFEHLQERATVATVDNQKYKRHLEELAASMTFRFKEIRSEQDNISLFLNPFAVPETKLSDYPADLQLEIIDLKCNTALRAVFEGLRSIPDSNDIIGCWKILPNDQYWKLRSFAQRQVCRFGTTYRCEQAFSAMKLIKSKQRSSLTDGHLDDLLRLSTTQIKPDFARLASEFHK